MGLRLPTAVCRPRGPGGAARARRRLRLPLCVVDDIWASVGSDNFNRRSWTHDSELSSAVLDTTLDDREPRDPGGSGDGARVFARDLRPVSYTHL